ncbi:alpha/beta hydrolase, partial [Halobacteriales archaeon QS_1_68_17]
QRVDDDAVAAPNGTLVDLRASVDAPVYDAAAIAVPALVVRGSLDAASTRQDALALFDDLGADDRTYAEIAGGTHFLQFEPPRDALTGAVRAFHERVESGSAVPAAS